MKTSILFTALISLLLTAEVTAQWEKVSQPERPVAYYNNSRNNIAVIQNNHDYQLSTDGGQTWKDMNKGLPANASLSKVAINQHYIVALDYTTGSLFRWFTLESNEWSYLGTGLPAGGYKFDLVTAGNNLLLMHLDNFFSNGRVYVSSDNGLTWHLSNTGMAPDFQVSSLRSTGTGAVAAGLGGVYASSDGGITWQAGNEGVAGGCEIQYLLHNDGEFIFTKDFCYNNVISNDGGKSWHYTSGLTSAFYPRSIAMAEDRVYMTGCCDYFNEDAPVVFYSDDKGITWNPVNSLGLTSEDVFGNIVYANGNLLLTANSRLFLSLDNGNSWIENMLADHMYYPLLHTDGQKVYISGDGGFFVSKTDGLTWNNLSDQISPTPFDIQTVWAKGQLVLASTAYSSRLFRSGDGGKTWTSIQMPGVRHIIETPAGIFITSAGEGRALLKSTDGGITWKSSAKGLEDVYSLSYLLNAGSKMFAATYGGQIFRSDDNGSTWQLTNNGISPLMDVVSLAYDNANDMLYAGSWYDYLYKSPNQGAGWTVVGFYPSASLAARDGNIYAWAGDKVAYSNDGGNSWSGSTHPAMAGGFGAATSIAIYKNAVFVGGSNGVFVSTNKGRNWQLFSTGLPAAPGVNLVTSINDSGKYLYAACAKEGIYRVSLKQYPDAMVQNDLGGILLASPNPASGETTVKFDLGEKTALVTLRILNTMGKEVFSQSLQSVSSADVRVPVADLSPGLYTIHLTDGAQQKVEKLMIYH